MRDKPWLLAATALAGALFWALAAKAAARPLIEPPIEIGGAKSLPWGDPASWNAISPAYNPDQLVKDALALLSPEVPIIVRMESLRRATIYSSKDPRVARQLKAELMSRVRVAEENGKADVLALFDLGYLVETCKQADWLNWDVFDEPNGYAPAAESGTGGWHHPRDGVCGRADAGRTGWADLLHPAPEIRDHRSHRGIVAGEELGDPLQRSRQDPGRIESGESTSVRLT